VDCFNPVLAIADRGRYREADQGRSQMLDDRERGSGSPIVLLQPKLRPSYCIWSLFSKSYNSFSCGSEQDRREWQIEWQFALAGAYTGLVGAGVGLRLSWSHA